MIFRVILISCFASLTIALFSQEQVETEKLDARKKSAIVFQGDSRSTIINRKSVGIYGVRLGVLINERYEFGIGGYSSNLFGFLGSSVDKNYQDNNVNPPLILDSNIGFHYFSVYGEYRLLYTERILLTINSQLGAGWVDIDFTNSGVDRKREQKNLIEHSVKVDVKILEWLRLNGGIGYRYLTRAETQIKNAFNAPIYIIGYSVDLKLLRDKIFNKKSRS